MMCHYENLEGEKREQAPDQEAAKQNCVPNLACSTPVREYIVHKISPLPDMEEEKDLQELNYALYTRCC